jgi:predicted enzyme related to lactoylglutathione lyase
MIIQSQFILYVSNQEKSTGFYQKVLQLVPCLNVPGMTEFKLSENTKLGLMPETGIAKILQNKTPHPTTGTGIPRCELYLLLDDVAPYIKRAFKNGAKIISPLHEMDWGDKVAYFSDHDGHIIAFAEKIN